MTNINLTQSQLRSAVQQILTSPNLRTVNPHLTDDEFQLLVRDMYWPDDKPVYTPYAITHNGYSQVRVNSLGKMKILTHRLTYWQFYNDSPEGKDVSYTLYVGSKTSSNINPLFLTCESNELNQSRKSCFMFFESLLRDRYQRLCSGSLNEPFIYDFHEWWQTKVRQFNGPCRVLHRMAECWVCWDE